MEKNELIQIIDNLLTPIGFKRKGNSWVINGAEVNRIINLQKSQHSNSFYINYGYILKSLPLNGFVNHISNRLGSEDKIEQNRITELLNLSNEIERKNRVEELTVIIKEKIINKIQFVETESDVLEVLENMKYLYTIPPFVLEHFNISIKWWFQYLYIDLKNGIVYDFKLNRPLEKWIVSLTWVN